LEALLGDKHATIHTSASLEAVVRTALDGHAIAVIPTAVIAIPEIGGIQVRRTRDPSENSWCR
jgi:hypothetical protein